jgi:hypothetical protein
MHISLSRRQFLGTTAAAGMLLGGGRLMLAADGDDACGLPPGRIHKVYVGRPPTAWPKPEFDLEAEVALFEKHLAEAAPKLAGIELVGGEVVRTPDEAAQVAAGLGEADGVLLVHLTLGTGGLLQRIVDAGRPTAVFSQPFSGHEWMFVPQWQKAGKRVALFATSDYGELAQAARLAAVPGRMAKTRLIVVGGPAGTASACSAEQVKERLGAEMVPVSVEEVVAAHQAIDPQAAEAEAKEWWIDPAQQIVEPSKEEIVKSARMYLAMKALMAKHQAQAITIRCLGGIPIDVLGYPCLGFSKLNDLGLVGACEADVDSTLTMLIFNYAFGVPGFISDPLFDTSKNALIHAHCTCATKMDGPSGQRAPFLIRTHRDDNKGASLEVQMRVGQPVTCAKLINLDTMLISAGKIIEITDFDDRGCRTQITTQVADARKMAQNWGAGLLDGTGMMTLLHRVVFYGDHVERMEQLGGLMGIKVVQEG